MSMKAPPRTTELYARRVPLTTGPAAAAEARDQVRAVICAWDVPVDWDVAVLLTSELVTNAIRHTGDGAITLGIRRTCGELRVDVYDKSFSLPELADAPADAEAGRGLALVANLSADWGFYRTPAGKTVYFTLAFQPDPMVKLAPVGTPSHARIRPGGQGASGSKFTGRSGGDIRPVDPAVYGRRRDRSRSRKEKLRCPICGPDEACSSAERGSEVAAS
jgi:anti-sigma regulatory factor (Ser/Thr protein kinase)